MKKAKFALSISGTKFVFASLQCCRSLPFKGLNNFIVLFLKAFLHFYITFVFFPQNTLTQSQDRAFRRISELKEQIQLDQKAKRDLEENYYFVIEEKGEFIKVLQKQVVQFFTSVSVLINAMLLRSIYFFNSFFNVQASAIQIVI